MNDSHTIRRHVAVAALLATALPLTAQEQATTLATLARRADLVVTATVVAFSDPSPEFHRVEFRTAATLRGVAAPAFALLEPSGRCCGRSLFGLAAGETCLLFLQRTGPTLHPLGGGRGVLPAAPAVVEHVAALLASADDDARLSAVLFRALDAGEDRIATDAAHALLELRELRANEQERSWLSTRTREVLASRHRSAPALLELGARLVDDQALDAALQQLLTAAQPELDRALIASLQRYPADRLTSTLLQRWPDDEARALRVAPLLLELPPHAGTPLLRRLATETRSPRVSLFLARAELARGVPPEQLRGAIPDAVLQRAASQRAAAPNLRNIRPELVP